MAEREVLRDAVSIGRIHLRILAETAQALGVLGLGQVTGPAWERMTLPVAVILNRLVTDFRVLMPLGRRIKLFQ